VNGRIEPTPLRIRPMGQFSCRMNAGWSWQNFSPSYARKLRSDRWNIAMARRSRVKTGQIVLPRASATTLRTRQHEIVKQLHPLNPPVIRGALITRDPRCGKPRCRCVTGHGQGPKSYLAVSKVGKRPYLSYIPQTRGAQLQEQLSQRRTFRALLEERCDIACELRTRRAGK
jgi:hypothetical protein